MLALNDISTWIEVDGKELAQYAVEEDLDHRRVTCWIAAQAGKNFSVVFRDNAKYREHSIGSWLELDGSPVRGKLLRPPANITALAAGRTVVQNDQPLSVTSGRPFMFSKLELTDEDEYLSQSSTHLGEICIHIRIVQVLSNPMAQLPAPITSGHSKIHERSKKAVTHCVSYGQEVKTEARYTNQVRFLDGGVPLATFIFKYRDAGLLQANGIMPKPLPTEKKPTVCEKFLDLTTNGSVKPEPLGDEIEVVHCASSSKRVNPSLEGEARPKKKIKRENTSIPIGEIIDLT